MPLDTNALRKLGFSKKQAVPLADALAASGSIPANILELKLPWDGPQQPIEWDSGAAPNGSGNWISSAGTWFNLSTLARLDGEAITYDPELGIEYTEAGVYLNHLSIRFVPGVGYDVANNGPGRFHINDGQYLDVVGETNVGFDTFQTTWMAVQSAGDTNTIPFLEHFRAKNPYEIDSVHYISVKLLA